MFQNIADKDTYLTYNNKKNIFDKCHGYQDSIDKFKSESDFFKVLEPCIISCEKELSILKKNIEAYNKKYVKKKKKEYQWLFEKSPFPLDEQQKTAVITDDIFNLVVAGAGSGKTEVLTTRIAYLIHRKPDMINPSRILALAFQRDASNEMKDRLKTRFGKEVEIRTFHSLGFDILRQAGSRYNLFGENNHEKEVNMLIYDLYLQAYNDSQFRNDVIKYMGIVGNEEIIKDESDFSTKEEFFNYQSTLPLISLDNTEVKSFGEQAVMNFFLSHEINGETIYIRYEDPADWMEYIDDYEKRLTPHPDFYLPDYDIYIEHWSIDKNNKPPKNYKGNYLETMKIKKNYLMKTKKLWLKQRLVSL